MTGGRHAFGGRVPGTLRETLIAVALELVDEGGATAVSVREAARRAGVSSGAPFRHFADRDALLEAVAEVIAIDFFNAQNQAAARAEGLAFRAVGIGVVRYAITYPHRFDLLRAALYRPGRSASLDNAQSVFDAFTTALVTQGQADGELRNGDPAIIRLAGHAIAYGLAQMIIDGYLPRDDAEDLATKVMDMFGTGILHVETDGLSVPSTAHMQEPPQP